MLVAWDCHYLRPRVSQPNFDVRVSPRHSDKFVVTCRLGHTKDRLRLVVGKLVAFELKALFGSSLLDRLFVRSVCLNLHLT